MAPENKEIWRRAAEDWKKSGHWLVRTLIISPTGLAVAFFVRVTMMPHSDAWLTGLIGAVGAPILLAGATFVIALLKTPGRLLRERNEEIATLNKLLLTDAGPDFMPITVADLFEAINNALPAKRDDLKRDYLKVRVRWIGYFFSMHSLADNRFQLTLYNPRNSFNGFLINIDGFPGIKLLRANSELVVEGVISEFSMTLPVLDPAKVISRGSA